MAGEMMGGMGGGGGGGGGGEEGKGKEREGSGGVVGGGSGGVVGGGSGGVGGGGRRRRERVVETKGKEGYMAETLKDYEEVEKTMENWKLVNCYRPFRKNVVSLIGLFCCLLFVVVVGAGEEGREKNFIFIFLFIFLSFFFLQGQSVVEKVLLSTFSMVFLLRLFLSHNKILIGLSLRFPPSLL